VSAQPTQRDTLEAGPGAPPAVHVASGEGTSVWLSGDLYTVKLDGAASGGSLTVMEGTVPPGAGPPRHIHLDADEAFFLLEGELEIAAADEVYRAREGDFVFIRRGTAHRFHNVGDRVAKQLLLFTPAGVEGFFLEAGTPAVPGTPPPPASAADNARAAAVGERYHLMQSPEER
jgi:quercetin dioxygenase-like cupin family protein